MTRSGLLFAWLVIACAAGLLTAESWIPGQVLLPLLPDDLPTWREGVEPGELHRHPAPNYTMSDVDHLLVPGLAVTRAARDRGELPWWDPSQALGVPHVSEVHYAVFYPPAWLPQVFGLRGLGLLAWFHLLAAGGGMLLYLRALRRGRTAALTGALAFALSAWTTARLQSFPAVGAAVWLPWMLWGLERGARFGKARSYLAAALALALSLAAGFPQVSLLGVAVAGWLELARLVSRRRSVGRTLRAAAFSLGAVGLGCLLAAGQLLPTLEYMRSDSARAEQDAAVLAQDGIEWPLLAHLVAPDLYSCAALTGPHPVALGTLTQATLPAALNRAETSMGIGVLGLLLALLAVLFGRTGATRAWALLVLLCFGLLLYPPAFEAAARWLPVLRFGSPKRLLFVVTTGLAVLASGGADLVCRERLRVTAMGWVAALAATTWAVVLMLGVPSAETPGDVDAWALDLAAQHGLDLTTAEEVYAGVPLPRESFELASATSFRSTLVMLAVALLAVVLFRPRKTNTDAGWTSLVRRAPDALPLVLAAELLITAFPLLRSAPTEGVFDLPGTLAMPDPPVVQLVRDAVGERVVPARVGRVGDEPSWLRPNLPVLFGLLDLQAYAPMAPRRTLELLAAIAPDGTYTGSHVGGFRSGDQLASPLVDLLGVDVVLTSDANVEAPGFVQTGQAGAIRVLRNDEAYPHAWCVSELRVSPARDDRPGDWIDDPGFDGRVTAALESPPPPGAVPADELRADELRADELPADEPSTDELPADELPAPERLPFGSRVVDVVEWHPGGMELHVGPGPGGALVVAESFHEDWQATVDGRPAAVVRADHALLAVPLAEGGSARVELRFAPTRPEQGLWFGAGGLLLAIAAVSWFDRRRPPVPEENP